MTTPDAGITFDMANEAEEIPDAIVLSKDQVSQLTDPAADTAAGAPPEETQPPPAEGMDTSEPKADALPAVDMDTGVTSAAAAALAGPADRERDPTPAALAPAAALPVGIVGRLARAEQSCFVCGQRWQRSLRHRLMHDVYMFALPRIGEERRAWLQSLHWWRSASAPPRAALVCSLHFAPSDCRPLAGSEHEAQLLPVALPRRSYHDWAGADRLEPCSFPLCRGQRRALLSVLTEIGQRGSPALRRTVRPYWSRRRFPLPEPGPVNQAWVDLFSEALNDRPDVPDEVELSYLCCLHFVPKWFRWENRGRPRQIAEPLGEPKLDKYAEPTIFSSSAMIAGLHRALELDLKKQADDHKHENKETNQGTPEGQPRCGYPHCPPDEGTVLFNLPSAEQEPARRFVWLRALRTVQDALGDSSRFNPSDCEVLCANHFNEEHITKEEVDGTTVLTLNAKAVPTRFKRPAPEHLMPEGSVSWPETVEQLITQEGSRLATDQDAAQSSEEEDASSARAKLPGGDGVPELQLHIKLEPHWEPPPPAPVPRGRGRGRPRGRSRGRPAGAGRAAPAPAPDSAPAVSPPSAPSRRGRAGRRPTQATLAHRQVQQLIRAASAGNFSSFRALDELMGATDPTPRSSADQLLRMCLMMRLKEGSYQRRSQQRAEESQPAE